MNATDMGYILSDIIGRTPSKSHSLIIGSHGRGWIPFGAEPESSAAHLGMKKADVLTHEELWEPKGDIVTRYLGEDSTPQNRFDVTDLAQAIASTGVKMEYILFDACFMANVESIYDLRNNAKYIVGSPCEIMGNGFPYHHTLPHLFADEGNTTDYVKAAESYYLFYRDNYSSPQRCGSITLFDCAQLDELANRTKSIVASANEEEITTPLQTYDGQNPHHFYDFGQWVNVVATDEQALERFNQQLDNTIIATFTLDRFYSAYGSSGTYPIDLDVYSGVTTSAPSKAYPKGWKTTSWYKDVWGVTEN